MKLINFLLLIFILIAAGCSKDEVYSKNTGSDSNTSKTPGGDQGNSKKPGDNSDDNGSTTDPSNKAKSYVEKLSYQGPVKRPVDILWVIDNSGSMRSEQKALASNFSYFIENFSKENLDFKMAVTTTGTHKNAGKMLNNEADLTSTTLRKDREAFIEAFKQSIKVSIDLEYEVEKGLLAAVQFLAKNKKFLRKDAHLNIVFVSDEDDQSSKTLQASAFVKYYQSYKSLKGLVKVFSIVNVRTKDPKNYIDESIGKRYIEASSMTSGLVSDIDEEFYKTLLKMNEKVLTLSESIPLTYRPLDVNSVQVYLDGKLLTNEYWEYDLSNNSIKLLGPADKKGEVVIEYTYKK